MARQSSINDSGITQIVKALEKSNDKQELIVDTLVGFNPVLQSPIVYDVIDNAPLFMAGVAETLTSMSDTLEGFNPVLNSNMAQRNLADSNAFLDLVSTSIFGIEAGIGAVLAFFTGRELQEEENRRELLAALERIGTGGGTSDPVPPPAEEKKKIPAWLMSFGAITAFGASLGALTGFMGEMTKMLTTSRGVIWKLRVRVRWFTSKGFKLFASLSEDFDRITTSLKTVLENNRFTKPFADVVKFIRGTTEASGGVLKLVGKALTGIKDGFVKFGKSFTWGAKLGKLLGKVLKAIAYPITIIMGAYATIMGAIKGWKEGGLLGALEGGISGLLVNLVGEIVDLAKDGISWVAKMLGFENFSKALDGFSFSALLDTGVKAIFGAVKYAWEYLAELFSPEKLTKSFSEGGWAGSTALLLGGILDMVKGAVSWIATMFGAFDFVNALDNFSIQDYLMKGVQSMIDFVTSTIDSIVKLFNEAPAMISEAMMNVSDMATEFAKKILKSVLPDASKHTSMADPLHWVGKAIPDPVYAFAGVPTPQQVENGLYSNTGGANPYVTKANALKAKDEAFTSDVGVVSDYIKGTSTDGRALSNTPLRVDDYLKSSPSSAGTTLNQSNAASRNAPVIINNMGGNVTNTTSSNVSNNSSPFEPILLGSSLGFASF